MESSKSRRDFIKKSLVAGIAIPFLGNNLLTCGSKEKSKLKI